VYRPREEHRLEMFDSRVLKKIFWHKRHEAAGDWRKLHIEELHGLYSSPNIFVVWVITLRRMV
jgi:hypothetical protein